MKEWGMATKHGLSRRELFRAGVGVVGVGLLAACAPQAPSSPTPAPAKPTEAPKPAEAAKPAAPAATTAPAATAAPAPAKPAEPKLGAQLIGKLEGPTIILDPAQYPKSFKEAPELAELVKAGKLPPVEQRVSQDPLVIKPVHEIAKYGGTWRRGFTGP